MIAVAGFLTFILRLSNLKVTSELCFGWLGLLVMASPSCIIGGDKGPFDEAIC